MLKPLLFLCLVVLSINTYTAKPSHRRAVANPVTQKDTAGSWALIPFVKLDKANPILGPGTGTFIDPIRKAKVAWEEKDVFNPAIVTRNGKVYMLYRAQDKAGTSRIGLAVSTDAVHFKRSPEPVFYPDNDAQKPQEWEGGCEDPRIVRDDKGVYYMTYTAYDGKLARLFIATSKDLLHWKKYGNVFSKAYHGKYLNKWAKSGSIVSKYVNGQAIATRINGKYWMYWGDTQIFGATSTDLINWTPIEMKKGEHPLVPLRDAALTVPDLKVILPTRSGKFDSDLVESGPPAMITEKGILLIYNSKNLTTGGDRSLPAGTYSAGQVLFDKNDPSKILHRMSHYFIKPEKPYEITGQVGQVCFLEGLTQFNGAWYIYYGTADSKIAVAKATNAVH